MSEFNMMNIHKDFREDIDKAIKILKEAGCDEIFLFGSVAYNKVKKNSDIDIAVKGCPKEIFFRILGTLLITLEHSVDLVDLDGNDRFGNFLKENGELIRVA